VGPGPRSTPGAGAGLEPRTHPAFGAIAASGAGLHVGAYYPEGATALGRTATVLATALPVGRFVMAIHGLGWGFVRRYDVFHLLYLGGSTAIVILSVVCAEPQLPMPWCLLVLMLAPAVSVIGHESTPR